MRVIVETMDSDNSGHLVEAGFDRFSITASNLNIDQLNEIGLEIYPNPSIDGLLFIESPSNITHLYVTDLSAKLILALDLTEGLNKIDLSELVSGAYVLEFRSAKSIKSTLWIRN